jgi:hypothetical protein
MQKNGRGKKRRTNTQANTVVRASFVIKDSQYLRDMSGRSLNTSKN